MGDPFKSERRAICCRNRGGGGVSAVHIPETCCSSRRSFARRRSLPPDRGVSAWTRCISDAPVVLVLGCNRDPRGGTKPTHLPSRGRGRLVDPLALKDLFICTSIQPSIDITKHSPTCLPNYLPAYLATYLPNYLLNSPLT